jgi:hypothetical protein
MKVTDTERQIKENAVGVVMSRPSFYRDCKSCGHIIRKGDEEVQVASSSGQFGMGYSHYHLHCFGNIISEFFVKKKGHDDHWDPAAALAQDMMANDP